MFSACLADLHCESCRDSSSLCTSCDSSRYLNHADKSCILPTDCDETTGVYRDDSSRQCLRMCN